MAKRPSDLDPGISADGNWVIEVDASDGASSTVETKKISLSTAVTLGTPSKPSFTALTLLNGWTGEAYVRSVDDGYLEVFLNVVATNATDDQIATLTSGFIPDYKIISFTTASTNDTIYKITVETEGTINAINASGKTIILRTNFKSKRLIP